MILNTLYEMQRNCFAYQIHGFSCLCIINIYKIFAMFVRMMKSSQAAKMMFSQRKKKVVVLCMNILEYIFPGVEKFPSRFSYDNDNVMIRPKKYFRPFFISVTTLTCLARHFGPEKSEKSLFVPLHFRMNDETSEAHEFI